MSSRRTEIQVGVTVLVALGVLLWGVTWLSDMSLPRKVRVWHVRFPQTGGLGRERRGAGERHAQGRRCTASRSSGDHVVVDLALDPTSRSRRDCRVAIRNVGLMGEKVIAVDLRTDGRRATPSATPSRASTSRACPR